MREVLPEGEGWITQGGSVCTPRGGGFSAVASPLKSHGGGGGMDCDGLGGGGGGGPMTLFLHGSPP